MTVDRTSPRLRTAVVILTILVCSAIVGMVSLSFLVILTGGFTSQGMPVTAVLGVIVWGGGAWGEMIGILTLPITLTSLRRRDLRLAVPPVYGTTLIVTCLMNWFALRHAGQRGQWMLPISGTGTILVMSIIVGRWLPPIWERKRQGWCIKCGYDLRGDYDHGCPECGWARDPCEGENTVGHR